MIQVGFVTRPPIFDGWTLQWVDGRGTQEPQEDDNGILGGQIPVFDGQNTLIVLPNFEVVTRLTARPDYDIQKAILHPAVSPSPTSPSWWRREPSSPSPL